MLQTATSHFLNEQLNFEGLVLILLSFHRVLEINLFDKFPKEVLIEVSSKLCRELYHLKIRHLGNMKLNLTHFKLYLRFLSRSRLNSSLSCSWSGSKWTWSTILSPETERNESCVQWEHWWLHAVVDLMQHLRVRLMLKPELPVLLRQSGTRCLLSYCFAVSALRQHCLTWFFALC